jgi:hypothetical protein
VDVERLGVLPTDGGILAGQCNFVRIARGEQQVAAMGQGPAIVMVEGFDVGSQARREVTERNPFTQVRERQINEQVVLSGCLG